MRVIGIIGVADRRSSIERHARRSDSLACALLCGGHGKFESVDGIAPRALDYQPASMSRAMGHSNAEVALGGRSPQKISRHGTPIGKADRIATMREADPPAHRRSQISRRTRSGSSDRSFLASSST